MNIKSLLMGSAAALVVVSGARAADAVIVAEPEPAEYVRVCDTYGAGFFYIPGSETCLKISGYMRYDARAGDSAYNGEERDTYSQRSRVSLRVDARNETELGTLRSYVELRFNFNNGNDDESVELNNGFIELGGFRVGATDSQFMAWTGYMGDIINDDVILAGQYVTNQISYTWAGGNGFSAMIGAEQGMEADQGYGDVDYRIDDYMPHIVVGARYEQAWGKVSGVAGYDSVSEEWAGKVRLDVSFTDTISAWVMGGYKSNGDEFENNYFGAWHGDYAVWGGLAAKLSEKATFNVQGAYEEDGTFNAAANVAYELVPGFMITPEISYTSFGGERQDRNDFDGNGDDAFEGIIRFQRNF
ncbi:porin [Phyllobacterium sp. 21LDTY02-6]|uniref:porin n=1 Tax=Phyllobacterium sp. 21LDTY02-6 TaxID=2944903 RepID=UPI0020207EC6|nr:porin [Phyllobacterium sp. 21LDTY02-6]MCO4319003.1 porin [Phyllobacterium sp. 21LDTY02-6]